METDKSEARRTRSISGIIAFAAFGVILLVAFSINILSANTNAPAKSVFEVNFGTANLASSGQTSEASKHIAANGAAKSSGEKTDLQNGEAEVSASNEIAGKFKSVKYSSTGEETQASTEVPGNTPFGKAGEELKTPEGKFTHSLLGRTIIKFPAVQNATNNEGKVVVDVVVDSEGKVTEATAGGRGTTTNSIKLKEQARKIAMETSFSKDQKREEQHGTIIIVFEFN